MLIRIFLRWVNWGQMLIRIFLRIFLHFKIPHHATLRFAVLNSEMKYCVALRILLAAYKKEFAVAHTFTTQLFKTTSLSLVLLKSCAKAWLAYGKPSHS
jgi:hypothetical protein